MTSERQGKSALGSTKGAAGKESLKKSPWELPDLELRARAKQDVAVKRTLQARQQWLAALEQRWQHEDQQQPEPPPPSTPEDSAPARGPAAARSSYHPGTPQRGQFFRAQAQ